MEKLTQLREQIDKIDEDIVSLLKKRADCVLEVKKTKHSENIDVYSPLRERQILNRVSELAKGGNFPLHALETIFTNIVAATRSLIGELQIAFPGPDTSLAGAAARKQFGESVGFNPLVTLEEVLSKVECGEMHFAVVSVFDSLESLLKSPLVVIAEVEVAHTTEAGVDTCSRFFVLGNTIPPVSGNDKTSLLCAVEERSGALREILKPFSDRGISLLKISSNPIRMQAWEHMFFIDIAGHQDEKQVQSVLKELREMCSFVKVLGSYSMTC